MKKLFNFGAFLFTTLAFSFLVPYKNIEAFSFTALGQLVILEKTVDVLQGLFSNDKNNEQAQDCMNKTPEQLKTELKQKYANFRSHPTDQAIDNEVSKEKLCADLLNAEDEEDTTYSETFLWKPISDNDGKAVTLLPTSLMGQVMRTQLYKGVEPNVTKLEAGRFTGNANGHRPHYRFTKPGSSYGGPAAVEAAVPEGVWVWLIKNASQRTEGVKGKFYSLAEIAAAHAAEEAAQFAGAIPSVGDFGNSCPAGFFDTNTNKSLKVMAMGDSNTKGSDASNLIGYRKAFKEDMTAMGYTVDMVGSQSAGSGFSDNQHEGYPGEGIAKLQQVANGSSLTTNNPDVILLLVGSNDMWISLDNRSPISDSAANSKVTALGNLIDTIHTKVPNTLVIVAKPGTPLKGGWAAPRPLGIYSTGIDAIATTRSYVSVVDFTSLKNNGDGTHYDATGYGKIAETFAKKIDELKRKCEETKTNNDKTYSSKTSCESATGFVCKSENDKWVATTTKLASSTDKLDVTCKVSDTTPGVDDDVDIWLEVSGGKTPYDGTWSGDYKKANDFDKNSNEQTVSFDKKGNYKIKITVEDADGEKAKDTCPTIKVSSNGENDKVTVRVENEGNNNTNTNSQTSSYSFYRDLTMGSRGDDVTALQNFLISTGYLVMPAGVDKGYFGGLTQTALGNWQKAHGISPNAGYFGPKTRAAIMGGTYVNSPAAVYTPATASIAETTNVTPSINNISNSSDTCVDISSTIYFGEENNNVGRVQQFLVNGGYLVMPAGASYGYYGRTTVTALSKFMAVRGIAHNGAIMDTKVLEQIRSVSCVN